LPLLNSEKDIESIFRNWQDELQVQPEKPPLAVLQHVLNSHGTSVTLSELHFGFRDVNDQPPIQDFPRFRDHAVAMFGADELRWGHAFIYLANGRTTVSVDVLAQRLAALNLPEAETVAAELDRNGDSEVDLHDILSELEKLTLSKRPYRATHVAQNRLGNGKDPRNAKAPTARPFIKPLPLSKQKSVDHRGVSGFRPVTPLQLQIGFFRLLQGAAYRSFRESYSANSETHLRARDLPYTIRDFRNFVESTVTLYLSAGFVVGERVEAEFLGLLTDLTVECDALEKRVNDWPHVHITPSMAAAEKEIALLRLQETDHRRHLADALEMALLMKLHAVSCDEMHPEKLSKHELNRMRHMELADERGRQLVSDRDDHLAWLDSWVPITLDAAGARRNGSIMPVRFWYETFMPRLLRCASIRSDADLEMIEQQTEGDLDAWHADCASRGEFDHFAADLRDGFPACSFQVKKSLFLAWRLTAPYLGGLQKRREREEFGRDSGAISQYVTFVDVYLNRSDVADAEMRISFPYFIGPAAWCFMHAIAEQVEALEGDLRSNGFAAFRNYFRALATMYPCPYCRYHLNRFVAVNAEIRFYPVEFLFLGQKPDKPPLEISLEDRLDTILADVPGSLRLFVWKFHNAVSSSIARTELWYHRELDPLYTTRHWPGFDAEIARAKALHEIDLPLERVEAVYSVLKQASHLATLRDELLRDVDAATQPDIADYIRRSESLIANLDRAIVQSGFLQRSYDLDPEAEDATGALSLDEESFARSGYFTER
jgi:hypothetical protein